MRANEFVNEAFKSASVQAEEGARELQQLTAKLKASGLNIVPLPQSKAVGLVARTDGSGGRDLKFENTGKYTPCADYSFRKIVVVNIGGATVPFYCSTGEGGKKSVPAGSWYPFFGIGRNGWINKGSEREIMEFYGSAVLKSTAQKHNSSVGDIRELPNSTVSCPSVRAGQPAMSIINKGLNPVADAATAATPEGRTQHINNMNSLLSKIGGGSKFVDTNKKEPIPPGVPTPSTPPGNVAPLKQVANINHLPLAPKTGAAYLVGKTTYTWNGKGWQPSGDAGFGPGHWEKDSAGGMQFIRS